MVLHFLSTRWNIYTAVTWFHNPTQHQNFQNQWLHYLQIKFQITAVIPITFGVQHNTKSVIAQFHYKPILRPKPYDMYVFQNCHILQQRCNYP